MRMMDTESLTLQLGHGRQLYLCDSGRTIASIDAGAHDASPTERLSVEGVRSLACRRAMGACGTGLQPVKDTGYKPVPHLGNRCQMDRRASKCFDRSSS